MKGLGVKPISTNANVSHPSTMRPVPKGMLSSAVGG